MLINAMAAREKAAALEPWSFESAGLGSFDCLLQVKACGICHSDIHMVDNDWGITAYPLVPGHEVVGEVIELGKEARHLQVAQRVGVGWQRSACLSCPDCLQGNENLCNDNQGVISHGPGGFADYLVMDSRFCFPLPGGIDTAVAGPLICGGITVYSALIEAGMRSGQEIGVIGVGGLGHMAVQFASRLGNRVTVFTTSQDKADFGARLGAHGAVVNEAGLPPEKLKRPLDILINTVPLHLDWNGYLNLLGSDGVLTFVGVPGGPSSIDLTNLIFKRRRIMASPIGGRGTMLKMLDLADRFEVTPVIERFPLARANEAFDKIRNNQIRYRAVLMD